MGKIVYTLITICLLFLQLSQSFSTVNIGALFDELPSETEIPLNSVSLSSQTSIKRKVIYNSIKNIISGKDSLEAKNTICKLLNTEGGISVIFGAKTSLTTPFVESVCSNFRIPYIITSWRDTFYKNFSTTINFHPDANLFAEAIGQIIKSFDWKGFYIVYETEEGLVRLQEVLKLQNVKRKNTGDFIGVRQLEKGWDQRTVLKSVGNATSKIILDCKHENIINILRNANELDMLNDHYSYFLTSLEAHTIDFSSLNPKANITYMSLFEYDSKIILDSILNWDMQHKNWFGKRIKLTPQTLKTETALYYDALDMTTTAIESLNIDMETLNTENLNCKEESPTFEMGPVIVDAIKKIKPMYAITGPIKFDENNNRIDFNLYVYNHRNKSKIATWFQSNSSLVLARSSEESAVLSLQEGIVQVSTKLGEPFLMEVEPKEGLKGNARFKGYTKDLMDKIAEKVKFEYELFITEGDSKYGAWDNEKKEWTGLIGDILKKRAHLAICDFTITHERQALIDFSQSFMTLGISILHKKAEKTDTNIFAFLKPFSTDLWLYSATFYLLVSLLVFIIIRLTPGDWENPHPCDENPPELENIWGIKNCHWVTLGAIMNQGCDILPKGISSRLAVTMWWFFALIITNSYMANLTAFLTKENLGSTIDSVEDLAKQNKIKYGLLKSGSTESFFKNSNDSLYQRMYEKMLSNPSVFADENKDGIHRVNSSKEALYAFLMESTQIEYQLETNCNFKQIGNWLDIKNYGIGMPLNAPYRGLINQAILELQESGQLESLKTKWWKTERKKEKICSRSSGNVNDASLTIAEVGGLFLVLGVGIAFGCILGFIDFLWNVKNIAVEEHITYWEALKIEVKFASNIWITKKRAKPDLSDSDSSNSRTDNKSIIQQILHSATSIVNLNHN